MPKKVLILGATGPTGLLTARKALEHDHIVTIYARNPSKVPTDISDVANVKIFGGDLTDAEGLSKAIEGQDVIVSLLGPAGRVEGTPFTDAYLLIFSLMKRWGVKRILAMGTPSITDPEDGFSIWAFLGVTLIRIIVNSAYKEIVGVGKVFETEATKDRLDWTIFRLGFLSNGAPQASKAGYVGQNGWVMKNQRADVASWLVNEVEKDNSKWIRKRPSLWS
ncbi:NmrA family protein [Bisporella sp. PMI_857]|nr:NmrA family protein [Bisporella sp. PMI_857]